MKFSDCINVGSLGSLTFTLTCVARSYEGPARTRRRRFLRLNDDGDGVRDLDGVLPLDDRGGVKDCIPKKLLGIRTNSVLEGGVRVTVIYTIGYLNPGSARGSGRFTEIVKKYVIDCPIKTREKNHRKNMHNDICGKSWQISPEESIAEKVSRGS